MSYSGSATPLASTSLVRVTERESGFFCDFEEMLSRSLRRIASG